MSVIMAYMVLALFAFMAGVLVSMASFWGYTVGKRTHPAHNTEMSVSWDVPVGSGAPSTNKVGLAGKYNITDASVSAGEDIAGQMKRFYCEAKLRSELGGQTVTLWDIRRDEIVNHIRFTAEQNEGCYFDGLPTTAQDQRFWFFFDLDVDWSMFTSAAVYLELNTALTEWATSTAYTNEVHLVLEEGPVEGTEAIGRQYSDAKTIHEIDLQGYTITDLAVIPATINTVDKIRLMGSDGLPDWDMDEYDSSQVWQKRWYDLADVANTDDEMRALRRGPMINEAYTGRKLRVETTSSVALIALVRYLVAKSVIDTAKTSVGDAARGQTIKKGFIPTTPEKTATNQKLSRTAVAAATKEFDKLKKGR